MTDKKIDQALDRAITALVPEKCEEILQTPIEKMEKHDEFTKQDRAKIFRLLSIRQAAAMVAGFFLCLVVWGAFQGKSGSYSIVAVDVNPGIELTVNKQNKVTGVKTINEEAKELLQEMELANMGIEDAADAMMEALYRYGYLGENKDNVMLVSVANKSNERQAELMELVTKRLEAGMHKYGIRGEILGQSFRGTRTERKLAKTYGITTGKAYLIEKIAGLTEQYSEQQLSELSVKELLALLRGLSDEEEITEIKVEKEEKEDNPESERTGLPKHTNSGSSEGKEKTEKEEEDQEPEDEEEDQEPEDEEDDREPEDEEGDQEPEDEEDDQEPEDEEDDREPENEEGDQDSEDEEDDRKPGNEEGGQNFEDEEDEQESEDEEDDQGSEDEEDDQGSEDEEDDQGSEDEEDDQGSEDEEDDQGSEDEED